MAFKMKGFKGFHDLFKKPTGPRAKVKKKIFKKFNPKDYEFLNFEDPKDRDKIYNKTEIKRP